MFGGLFKTTSLAALLAAGMVYGGASAQAADLGGDCCADLEERVAELEATTARKGNRKVSLTVSGWVNELVYYWDDGIESNIYQGTSGYASTRFRFDGKAKINADWMAGYMLEIEAVSAQVSGNTAVNDDAATAMNIRHSYWYLQSKTLGKLSVGQQSHATDDIVLYSLAGIGPMTGPNHNAAPGAAIGMRNGVNTTGITVASVWEFIDSDRANLVRYDSPALAGFTVSTSWGEDDMWDVALRYAGEFNGIKIAGGIGYHEERDGTGDAGPNIGFQRLAANCDNGAACQADFDDIRGSISVMHSPTGLFVDFAAVQRQYDSATGVLAAGVTSKEDMFFWAAKAGIQQKWTALGKTTIFGEYGEVSGALTGRAIDVDGAAAGGAVRIFDDEGTTYGIGLVQSIDAAAMELYLGYRHFEVDVDVAAGAVPLGDLDTVYAGGRISF